MRSRDGAEATAAVGPFEVEVVHDCAIPAGDTMLAADLYRPVGAAPVPALVTLVPYPKDGAAGIGGRAVNRYFAANGYATLLVNLRGTGVSGGLPRPPFDRGDAEDGAAVVEWAAAQPWCTGNVGMWGVSYGAFTSLGTASLNPAPLKAIAAVMGFIDPERDFVHPAGRRGCLASLGMWSLNTLVEYVAPPLADDPDGELERRWRDRVERVDPFAVDLLRHGPGDPVWRTRTVDVDAIRVPAFCVAGWRDLFCDPTLRAYAAIRAPKQLLVGPWMHTLPDEAPEAPIDFLSLALAWWRRWLLNREPDPDARLGATIYVQGRDEWRSLQAWPPDGVGMVRLHAGADGGLCDTPVSGRVERRLDATVGAHGELRGLPVRGFGKTRDQHEDDARSLAFTSDPLERPLELYGVPQVTIAASGTDSITAKLAELTPNGRSRLITSGTLTLSGSAHGGRCTLALVPTAYVVPTGHRLRLVLSGDDFPHVWPSASGDVLKVECGDGLTSIELPIRDGPPGDLVFPPAPDRRRPPEQSPVLRADPLSTLTRDAISDGVTVTVGEHLVVEPLHSRATLDMNWFVSATVAPRHPEEARLGGKATIHADADGRESVTRVELLVSSDAATITGEVTVENERVFERRWTVDLNP